MKGTIWVVMVIGIMLVVGAVAIPATLSESAQNESVEGDGPYELDSNYTTQIDPGETIIELSENVSVESTDGTVYEEGTHYEIDWDRGTITAINNSAADGDEVLLSYNYTAVNERSGQIAGLYGLIGRLAPFVFLVSAIGAVLAILGRL